MKYIYLDHSATTPVDEEVLQAMLPYFHQKFGNPSSIHRPGQEARVAVEEARSTLAGLLGVKESEVYFVSGGTEADNFAIKGVAYANRHRGNHLITSQVEHSAVLESCRALEKEGFEVTYLPVDQYGRVDPDDVRKSITRKTILISIVHGNNEVGTINPVEEIARIAAEQNVYFHTDAVQSFGKVPLSLSELPIHLLSISGHKIYGPKGIGALIIRQGTVIEKILHGGHHERDRRAGTENVPGIVGLARAAEKMVKNMNEYARHVGALRDYFWEELQKRLDGMVLNGHPRERLYHNLNVSFLGCEAQALLLTLDMNDVAVSTGAACSSGSVRPSHVLTAMRLPAERVNSAIRFTLGKDNTREEIDTVLDLLEKSVPRLRGVSRAK